VHRRFDRSRSIAALRDALRVAATLASLLLSSHTLHAQRSTVVHGDVTSSRDGTPVAGATVQLPAERRAVVSDSAGIFRLDGILAGTHALVVRRLGYAQVSAIITTGRQDTLEVSIVLDPRVQLLDTMTTLAERAPLRSRAEFEQRRRVGVGRFLTETDLMQSPGEPLRYAIQRRVPGVRPVYDPRSGAHYIASLRGPAGHAMDSSAPCYAQIYLDGTRVFGPDGGEPWDIDQVAPATLSGVEYYDAAATPAQYRGNGSWCGTLLMWTR
jgi:hypothetical protein